MLWLHQKDAVARLGFPVEHFLMSVNVAPGGTVGQELRFLQLL